MTARRALVVSTGRDRGALAAARALGAYGWTVGVGTPDGGGMVGASRAVTHRHVVPRPRGDGAAFRDAVVAATSAGGYDVVFGGGDDWTAALATYRDELPLTVAHPSAPVVRAALDKARLAQQAEVVGMPTPRTVVAAADELARWRGPAVVKCRSHWLPGQQREIRVESTWCADTDAARRQVRRLGDTGDAAVLQEPVDGRLGALIGLFHDGRLHGRVQQVASRLWPTPSGASARAVTVPVDAELAAAAERLLGALGWHGLVELQFLTGADGVSRLIDLNGRFFGSLALSEAARPGLVDAWASVSIGKDLPDLTDGAVGVRYAWLAGDLRRARIERRGGLLVDLAQSLRWAVGARHSVGQLGDLRPALSLLTARLRGGDPLRAAPGSVPATSAPVP